MKRRRLPTGVGTSRMTRLSRYGLVSITSAPRYYRSKEDMIEAMKFDKKFGILPRTPHVRTKKGWRKLPIPKEVKEYEPKR